MYLAGIEVATGKPTKNPQPCLLCRRVIINAGIKQVIVRNGDGRIVHYDPQDWINQENEAARRGKAAPEEVRWQLGARGR